MSLIKNAIYNVIYQVLNVLIPIITIPYISRVLGSNGIGEYSYTNSYVQYFMLLGMLGIAIYGNRQIAYLKSDRNKIEREFINIYMLQVIANLVALTVYIIIFVIINTENRALYLAQGINLLSCMLDISWFFIGYENMKSVVLRNTVVKVIGVILIFIFVKNENDIILYTIILSTSMVFGQLIMWFGLNKYIGIVKPSLEEMKKHLKPIMTLFISQIAVQIYVLLDKTMLGIIKDASEVGFYTNSQKTIKLALTLSTSIGVVMLPRMSSLHYLGKKEEFKNLMEKSFSFCNVLAIPIFFGLFVIASSFSPWFYGQGFDGIQNLIRVGAIIIIPISISNVLGMQIMMPIGREKQFTISVICGLIVNFILNLIMIPLYGSMGSMIASVFSEFVITIVQLYFLKDIIEIKMILKTLKKPLIGSIGMSIIVYLLTITFSIGIISTFIEVVIGGIIYLIIMLLLKEEIIFIILNKILSKYKQK